jgi:hypothetical protein
MIGFVKLKWNKNNKRKWENFRGPNQVSRMGGG